MSDQKAIRHHEFGKPEEVLRLETIPVPQPKAGEVRVRLLAASINPSDYGMIGGSYGRLRELPAVAGREGVGEVDSIGPGVEGVSIGQRVRFPGDEGAWRKFACIGAGELLKVPAEIPVDQAAVSFINPPTAYCLLHHVIDMRPGDWLVQNAGNSAVGVAVIQIARSMGLRTISQVRREELIEPLKAMGADAVVMEGSNWPKSVDTLTGGAPVRLALNSIGGESAIDQIKSLGEGGTQVTFGGMVGDKVRFPTRFLIFNNVSLVGFWWDQWVRRQKPEALREVMDAIYRLIREHALRVPIEAKYSFDEFTDALEHAQRPRLGKVLIFPS